VLSFSPTRPRVRSWRWGRAGAGPGRVSARTRTSTGRICKPTFATRRRFFFFLFSPARSRDFTGQPAQSSGGRLITGTSFGPESADDWLAGHFSTRIGFFFVQAWGAPQPIRLATGVDARSWKRLLRFVRRDHAFATRSIRGLGRRMAQLPGTGPERVSTLDGPRLGLAHPAADLRICRPRLVSRPNSRLMFQHGRCRGRLNNTSTLGGRTKRAGGARIGWKDTKGAAAGSRSNSRAGKSRTSCTGGGSKRFRFSARGWRGTGYAIRGTCDSHGAGTGAAGRRVRRNPLTSKLDKQCRKPDIIRWYCGGKLQAPSEEDDPFSTWGLGASRLAGSTRDRQRRSGPRSPTMIGSRRLRDGLPPARGAGGGRWCRRARRHHNAFGTEWVAVAWGWPINGASWVRERPLLAIQKRRAHVDDPGDVLLGESGGIRGARTNLHAQLGTPAGPTRPSCRTMRDSGPSANFGRSSST